jgi:3-hydroxyisobutyrate dehydrogenase-like beta-hydroxyacid dehydrogenase
MTKPTIGFIGLGLMGAAMVERLQTLGYAVTVIAHRNRANVDLAVGRGAQEAKTAKDLASASDVVMLCVDTSASVEARMLGPDGVISGAKAGAIVIDFGTSMPDSTRRLGDALAAKGVVMLDAPLGRTPAHAKEGKLNIMGAGDLAAFDRVKPVLEDLGENVFHVGPLGAGHALKLINNFFAMTTACAMSEAFVMADLAGLPREKLYSVMSAGPLRSGMMDFIKAQAIDGMPDTLAFSITNARKDVGYYVAMADQMSASSLISPCTKQAFELAVEKGWGDHMVPEMVDFVSKLFHRS